MENAINAILLILAFALIYISTPRRVRSTQRRYQHEGKTDGQRTYTQAVHFEGTLDIVCDQETQTHPIVADFVYLHDHSSDSIEAQDLYYAYLTAHGLTSSGGWTLTDDQAREKIHIILELPTNDNEKYALLTALDVEIQNHNDRGMASPVINEVLEEQYRLIQKGNLT